MQRSTIARVAASAMLVPALIGSVVNDVPVGALTAPRAEVWESIGPSGATATALAVRLSPPTPPTAVLPTTSPTVPPTTPDGGQRFETLPPGSVLPSDAACAARVRDADEIRPGNAQYNGTRGVDGNTAYSRVTGDFTGSTDEILQWVACKWGVDEDVVRSQIAKESWWQQTSAGDLTTNTSACVPGLPVVGGQCAESIGLGQVRYQYHGSAFVNNNAVRSSAYNLDYTYAVWRSCFEGELGWLNTVERAGTYGAGDLWGCIGVWFSGRWYVGGAPQYIASVKDYLNIRIWERPEFQADV